MDFTFKYDYCNDRDSRRTLIDFALEIFGLDLTEWDRKGFWDPLYRPFSLFDGGRVISNVSVYTLNMCVMGRPCKAAQFSTVATRPEYQRQGLNKFLTEKALEWASYEHDFIFLFADDQAVPYYQKCGFRKLQEFIYVTQPGQTQSKPGIRQLDAVTDIDLLYRYAGDREFVSNVFGVNNDKLLMYHFMYVLKDHIYQIPDLDVIILGKKTGDTIRIFDVIGQSIPSFEKIYPYIYSEGTRYVEFMFVPDRMNIAGFNRKPVQGNNTHIYGRFPLKDEKTIIPFTAHA